MRNSRPRLNRQMLIISAIPAFFKGSFIVHGTVFYNSIIRRIINNKKL